MQNNTRDKGGVVLLCPVQLRVHKFHMACQKAAYPCCGVIKHACVTFSYSTGIDKRLLESHVGRMCAVKVW